MRTGQRLQALSPGTPRAVTAFLEEASKDPLPELGLLTALTS